MAGCKRGHQRCSWQVVAGARSIKVMLCGQGGRNMASLRKIWGTSLHRASMSKSASPHRATVDTTGSSLLFHPPLLLSPTPEPQTRCAIVNMTGSHNCVSPQARLLHSVCCASRLGNSKEEENRRDNAFLLGTGRTQFSEHQPAKAVLFSSACIERRFLVICSPHARATPQQSGLCWVTRQYWCGRNKEKQKKATKKKNLPGKTSNHLE